MLKIKENSLPIPAVHIERLKATQQNPRYHAEGNVYNHTLLVLEQFEKFKYELDLSAEEQEVLYWAAILHDIGKPVVTQWVKNRWSARGHEKAGVPIARNFLHQRPEISASQRQRILDLVRWHNLPLWWLLDQQPESAFKRLATRVDLKLLGYFSRFDMLGRICEDKLNILALIDNLNQHTIPKIIYELERFPALQEAYQKASLQKKNALWSALRQEDMNLLSKLLDREPLHPQRPTFHCVMAIGVGDAEQTAYLRAQYPAHVYYRLDAFFSGEEEAQERKNKIREVKRFLSVYMHGRKPVVLDGTNLEETLRIELADHIRQSGGELHYLFFDRSLDGLLAETEDNNEKVRIEQAYQKLEMPHPWEAHKIEIIEI